MMPLFLLTPIHQYLNKTKQDRYYNLLFILIIGSYYYSIELDNTFRDTI